MKNRGHLSQFRLSRRDWIRSATAISLFGGSVTRFGYVNAQVRDTDDAPAIATDQLSESAAVFHGPDANSLVVATPDGLVMVDSGHSDWSEGLLEAVSASFPERAFSTLINTHWHPEQTGSNAALGEQGVEIIAHENTRLWLGVEISQRWSGQVFAPLPEPGRPTTGLHGSTVRDIGGVTFELNHLLHAHTDGDLSIYLPDDDILVTGGHVSANRWPVIDWWTGGWIGGMLDGFDTLMQFVTPDTQIVPAHGPVMTMSELTTQHEMYLTIFDRLHSALRRALSPDEAVAEAPAAEYEDKFGDSELFVRLAFESMWGHLRDAHDRRMQNIP